MKYITIKNANVHNLKNIDIQIPKNKPVSIVGVSGSGKSSIVYDILPMVSYRQLSFNSPEGMCLACQGRGHRMKLHMENIISTGEDTLYDICKRLKIPVLLKSLYRFTDYYEMNPKTVKFTELDRKKRNQFLYGFNNPDMAYGTYWGVIPAVESSYQKGTLIPNIASETKCSCCQGYKLGEAGRSLKFRGLHICEMQSLNVTKLNDMLLCAQMEQMHSEEPTEDTCQEASLDGACHITGYVYVSQYPIGRNNRSTVATYIGLMKHVQAIFAKQDQSKEYKGRNIAVIMELTIAEAKEFFDSEKKIQSILCELESFGLGLYDIYNLNEIKQSRDSLESLLFSIISQVNK